jgi:transcriptional regulator with XRE-family HTH domain
MAGIRDILASNLKEYRRKLGFSQDKLAELAGISSQYLATVETCRKFPTPEVLDCLAEALNIETHELFSFASTPQKELEKLRQDIIEDVVKTIKQSLVSTPQKELEKLRQDIIEEVIKTIKTIPC